MNNYTFVLKFEDANHSLTNTNGIGIERISELLLLLSKAVSPPKDSTITLSEVRSNCYAIVLNTNRSLVHDTLVNLHTRIDRGEIQGFDANQKNYTKWLKSIIEEGYTLSAYNDKDFCIDFSEILLPYTPEFYYERDDIYGIIIEIGGKNANEPPHIRLDRHTFNIIISEEQEEKLKNSYKKDKLLCNVRLKRAYEDDKILKAELYDFEIIPQGNFKDNIKILQEIHGDLFHEVEDSVQAVRNLYPKDPSK